MKIGILHTITGRRLKLGSMILFYYFMCIVMSFATKYYISKDGYDFRFPILKTAMSNMCHFVGALLCLLTTNMHLHPWENISETLVCSLVGAFDIGVSIYTLRQVEIAYYTILKSATPIFIVLSGFILGTEQISVFTLFSIVLIASGTSMATVQPVTTNNLNACLLLLSAIISGFRWSFIQFIISKKKNNIYLAIRDLCLPTSMFLFGISAYLYPIHDVLSSQFFSTLRAATLNLMIICIMGFFSFTILLCELWIVNQTSVLFLSVLAVLKELGIVGISILRGSLCMTKINYLGISISIFGILMYNGLRYTDKKDPED